ncbi:L-type lectin-domain containing receptor kinase IX.1-like [Chenopodium quinoa]|uniref:L-type lectin-domain containing receptor kinase IX.1-like n=1 Tax=Chenopodium quinoa TaxID=63459 RepID=UPI000B76FB1F|nr:L-type lectin-domain containing receptor kinase IX.1-like [Chenopodium quinoa]
MSLSIRSFGSSLYFIPMTSTIFHIFILLLFVVSHVQSLSFSFSSFNQNTPNITLRNDTTLVNGAIQLTANRAVGGNSQSVGRASYNQAVRLWDKSTNKTTNFTTHFSFDIAQIINNENYYGDGLAFFLAPFNVSADAPGDSSGGCLGLIGGQSSPGQSCNVTSTYPFVAVEFDSFHNRWDPGFSGASSNDHVGINVNSVYSKANFTVTEGLKNRSTANAWITYDSSTRNLSVYLSYDANPVFNGDSNISYVIDLRSILPERVRVGFASATGANYELHNILSWDFNSTLEDVDISVTPPPQNNTSNQPSTRPSKKTSKAALVGGLVGGISVIIIGLGALAFMWRGRRSRENNDDINFDMDDDDFDQDTGPRRFTYSELIRATNNFPEEGKLGQGGFGGVYRGYLSDLSRDIAVKKISRGSKQGKKEYVSEVKVISRLRHKNLVQLLGWCHERGDLLLVYEFMSNGSLDTHIYANKRKMVLPWTERYRIAHGLASALLYLHEEWEQCVLHRDIKSSNVMLDSNFNAKLGDFGLARLVDHSLGSQTTVLAGTLGYLAPECVMTGKSSKESDVYSFGVVALEIACGRRPVESKEEPSKVSLIEWVWQLYGEGRLLDAVDETLKEGDCDIQELECLMIIGLWCCHPEHTFRPSIRQVINALNKESPLPNLPTKFPVPTYCSLPTNVEPFYISSSSGLTGSSATGTTSSSSAHSVVSGTTPLLVDNARV